MSNPILEGMARAFNSAPEYADVDGMRAALRAAAGGGEK